TRASAWSRRRSRRWPTRTSWSTATVEGREGGDGNVECLMLNVKWLCFSFNIQHSTFNIPRSPFPSLSPDLRKKRLTRHRPPQKHLHQIPRRLFTSPAQDHLPKAAAGLGVHHVRAERGDEIERDHFRPHVAVV